MDSDLAIRSASAYQPADLAALFDRSFADYLVPVHVAPDFIHAWIKNDSLDIETSRVLMREGREIGLGLIARRGWTSRLAAFAIEPGCRRQGVGRWFMRRLLEEAVERGDRSMALECIEQNEAGIGLYRSLGFEVERRLVGYAASHLEGVPETGLDEIDPAEVARAVAVHGDSNLPWQISAETLAQLTPSNRGYRLGLAYAILSDPNRPQITLKSLVVETDARGSGWATRLLRALAALYPSKAWRTPVLVPEEFAPELWRRLGFQRESLSQLQMRRRV